jgi:serine/threonine protein kinase
MSSPQHRVGPFEIQSELWRNQGIGLCRALDTRTQRTVVCCWLDLRLSHDPGFVQRFTAATQPATQLRHAHLLSFAETGEAGPFLYAATAPLSGATLADQLQAHKTTLPMAESVALIEQIAAGLDAAHQQGLLHLALTPETIWLSADGNAQVIGMHLLQLAGADAEQASAATQAIARPIALSPYTAPEQVRSQSMVDRRADVYSLGAIAYTLLVGQPPFVGADRSQLATAILHRLPPAPQTIKPDLPPGLISVLRFVLTKDPGLRYANAGEFASALIQAQQWERSADTGETLTAVRPWPLALIGMERHIRRLWPAAVTGLIVLWIGLLLLQRLFPQLLSERAVSVGEQPTSTVHVTILAQATPDPSATFASANIEPSPLPVTFTHAPVLAVTVTETVPPTTVPTSTPAGTATAMSQANNQPASPTPSASATEQPSMTPTPTKTRLPTATHQHTPSRTATRSSTPTPRPTDTPSPTTTRRVTADESPAPTSSTSVATRTAAPVFLPTAVVYDPTEVVTGQEVIIFAPLILSNRLLLGTVMRDANLRGGPGLTFPVLGVARAGESLALLACNQGCTWYQITDGGWIAAFLVQTDADPQQALPIAPPTTPLE